MLDSDFYYAAGGYRETDYPVEGGGESYQYPTHPAAPTPQDHRVSHYEQSIVPGGQNVDAYGQSTSLCFWFFPNGPEGYQGVTVQETYELLDSGNFIHPPPLDPRATFVPTANSTNDMMPANFVAPQRVVQSSPSPGSGPSTPEHEMNGGFGAQNFHPDPSVTSQPYSTAMELSLPAVVSQPTSVVARKPNAQRQTNPSVSNYPGRVRDEETTELPAVPPSVASVGFQNPKEQRTASPVKTPKVRRTCRRRPQHPGPGIPTHIPPPLFLPTRLDLCIVEQVPYQCESAQKGWIPPSTLWIDFKVKGLEGIRLTDAMDPYFGGLDDRDDLMFAGDTVGTSVSCRNHFVGYPACSKPRQIVTTDHKKNKSPITKEKLAYEVAKCIKVYLAELEKKKTPYTVRFEDMFVTRIVNVSRASWQPHIWYKIGSSTSS